MINLKKYILDVPDFPQQGVIFKDITPLLNDGAAFKTVIDSMAKFAIERHANVIVAPEARGFMFGPAVSYANKIGFVPIRKPNKLPRATIHRDFTLEYGPSSLELHKDALKKGDKVLIIDDVLATGNTANVMAEMIESMNAEVVGFSFLIILEFLHGKELIKNYPIQGLITY